MKNHLRIITVLFLMLKCGLVNGQVFTIQSFDGSSQNIHISPNDGQGELNISYLNDTLHIIDFNGPIGNISRLGQHFLRVDYKIRGGSGIRIENTVVLCVKQEKLVQSLHITSLFREEFIDFSRPVDPKNMIDITTVHKVKLALMGNDSKSYRLRCTVHEAQKAKRRLVRNYQTNKAIVLKFDAERQAFYSEYQHISRSFDLYDPKSKKEIKKLVKGNFPVVALSRWKYYQIIGEWYGVGGRDNLSKYGYH